MDLRQTMFCGQALHVRVIVLHPKSSLHVLTSYRAIQTLHQPSMPSEGEIYYCDAMRVGD